MGMFEEKPHSPHSDRNRSGPAARNSGKSRIMARENDCGEPGLRRSSSSTIPQAKGVILKTFAGSSGLYSMQAALGRVARWVGGDQPAHNTNDQKQ